MTSPAECAIMAMLKGVMRMTEYWVTYRMNGTKHVVTGLEGREGAIEFIAKMQHICVTLGWDLTDVNMLEVC